jgi:hypothetical protein
MTTEHEIRTKIKVTVTFSFSTKPPFHDEFESSDTLLHVRQAAMGYFEVNEDPASVYYLSFRRQRQDDGVVLGELAGSAHAVEFRLIKELIQG